MIKDKNMDLIFSSQVSGSTRGEVIDQLPYLAFRPCVPCASIASSMFGRIIENSTKNNKEQASQTLFPSGGNFHKNINLKTTDETTQTESLAGQNQVQTEATYGVAGEQNKGHPKSLNCQNECSSRAFLDTNIPSNYLSQSHMSYQTLGADVMANSYTYYETCAIPHARTPSPPPGFHLYPQQVPVVPEVQMCPMVAGIPVYSQQRMNYSSQPNITYPFPPPGYHNPSPFPSVYSPKVTKTSLCGERQNSLSTAWQSNQLNESKQTAIMTELLSEQCHSVTSQNQSPGMEKTQKSTSTVTDVRNIPLPIGPACYKNVRFKQNRHKSELERINESPENSVQPDVAGHEEYADMPHLEKSKPCRKNLKFETNIASQTCDTENKLECRNDMGQQSGDAVLVGNDKAERVLPIGGNIWENGDLTVQVDKIIAIAESSALNSGGVMLEGFDRRQDEVTELNVEGVTGKLDLNKEGPWETSSGTFDKNVTEQSKENAGPDDKKDVMLSGLKNNKENKVLHGLKSPKPLRRPLSNISVNIKLEKNTEIKSPEPSLQIKSDPEHQEDNDDDRRIMVDQAGKEFVAKKEKADWKPNLMDVKFSDKEHAFQDHIKHTVPSETNKDTHKAQTSWCKGFLAKTLKKQGASENWDEEICYIGQIKTCMSESNDASAEEEPKCSKATSLAESKEGGPFENERQNLNFNESKDVKNQGFRNMTADKSFKSRRLPPHLPVGEDLWDVEKEVTDNKKCAQSETQTAQHGTVGGRKVVNDDKKGQTREDASVDEKRTDTKTLSRSAHMVVKEYLGESLKTMKLCVDCFMDFKVFHP